MDYTTCVPNCLNEERIPSPEGDIIAIPHAWLAITVTLRVNQSQSLMPYYWANRHYLIAATYAAFCAQYYYYVDRDLIVNVFVFQVTAFLIP